MSFRRIIIGSLVLTGLVGFRPGPPPESWLPQLDRFLGTSDPSKSPFVRIGGIIVDRSRNVVVSQPDSMRVFVFRPDGSTLSAIGKRGKGAGEFTAIGDMGRIGDTLWVIDERGAYPRFHLYGPDYRYLTALEMRLPPLKPKALPAVQLALLQNGHVLSRVPTAIAIGTSELVTSTRAGSRARVLAVVKRSRTELHLPALNTTLMFPALGLLDDFALARVIPGGGGVIVVDRTAAARPGPATYSLTHYKPDGTVVWKRQFPYTAEPAPLELAEGPIDRAADDIAKAAGGKAKALELIRRNIGTLPKTIPPIDNFIMGGDGTIWLSGHGVGAPWAVFDASGTRIANALIPASQVLATGQRGWGWLVTFHGTRWVLGQYKLQPQK
jgi:hypothetical protein